MEICGDNAKSLNKYMEWTGKHIAVRGKDAHCFPIHADSTDNFLFHVSGKIRWYIYKRV